VVEASIEPFSISQSQCKEAAFPYQTTKEEREFAIRNCVYRTVQSVFDPYGGEVIFALINGEREKLIAC
jgi:hypothetical protein